MDWFYRNTDIRNNIEKIIPQARSVISFAWHYPLVKGNIASYAQDNDYHHTIKGKLNSIINELQNIYQSPFEARAFVDSAPILERYWAQKSGLGWIGRSGMLINREFGGTLLLGEIVITINSDKYDIASSFNGCNGCYACINNCPTGALTERGVDSRRCLSYLTIEHRGDFNDEQNKLVAQGGQLFGCDNCLKCCKWTNRAPLQEPSITVDSSILTLSNSQFKAKYGSTSLDRARLKGLQRNFKTINYVIK